MQRKDSLSIRISRAFLRRSKAETAWAETVSRQSLTRTNRNRSSPKKKTCCLTRSSNSRSRTRQEKRMQLNVVSRARWGTDCAYRRNQLMANTSTTLRWISESLRSRRVFSRTTTRIRPKTFLELIARSISFWPAILTQFCLPLDRGLQFLERWESALCQTLVQLSLRSSLPMWKTMSIHQHKKTLKYRQNRTMWSLRNTQRLWKTVGMIWNRLLASKWKELIVEWSVLPSKGLASKRSRIRPTMYMIKGRVMDLASPVLTLWFTRKGWKAVVMKHLWLHSLIIRWNSIVEELRTQFTLKITWRHGIKSRT